ncbi:aspartate/glutamate racemase family protein [Shimia sp. R9_1]|uniref:maleate cis-trans isomerase family protein n=1 Tax=Shimia sp. R9_1 TaxID=2821111 RepID=UPI001ADC5D84|nr:aspartate/glutamate racemase family protein [Shimia sp. R9_1]MBO9409481.1 aspartate/glutamate racemase family protein [Shimia sp. R9_1]
MDTVPFTLGTPASGHHTLGLIVLKFDETLEQDFRRLFPSRDLALYTSRVPSGAEVTTDTLQEMSETLPASAALFPPAARFDAVGYGCTSGTTMIGAAKVAGLVQQGVNTPAVTDPLTAAIAACRALNITRLGMVTPYVAEVSLPVQRAFEAAGISVPALVSFGEAGEENVARITADSVKSAALKVGQQAVDAVFLSCTNLQTLDVIADLEATLSKPVFSSNTALAWHMVQLSGAPLSPEAPGQLFAHRSAKNATNVAP